MRERDWRTVVTRALTLVVILSSLGLVGMVLYGGGFGRVADAAERLPIDAALVAVGLVAMSWGTDALRYRVIARPLGVVQPLRGWLSVALVNMFGAYAVNLGAPAAAYVLARRDVDAGTSFALSIAKQCLYVPAALGPMSVLVMIDPSLVGGSVFRAALVASGALGLGTLTCLVAIAVWPAAATRGLVRLRLPVEPTRNFVSAISTIFRAPATLGTAFALAVINQAAIAGVAVVLLGGFSGAAGAGDPDVWVRALVFSAVSQSSPTPAGAGITELAGAWLFAPFAPAPIVVVVVLTWRFLALQIPILVGGLLLARTARVEPRAG